MSKRKPLEDPIIAVMRVKNLLYWYAMQLDEHTIGTKRPKVPVVDRRVK